MHALFSLLYKVCIPVEGVVQRVWEGVVIGSFTVASFFSALRVGALVSFPYESIWKFKAPPRVLAFVWLAISGCIPTMDNL